MLCHSEEVFQGPHARREYRKSGGIEHRYKQPAGVSFNRNHSNGFFQEPSTEGKSWRHG